MRSWLASLVVALSVVPSLAHAQGQEGAFAVDTWLPAPGPQGFLTVDGARIGAPLTYAAALFVTYAEDPFAVYPESCSVPRDESGSCPGSVVRANEPLRVVDSIATGTLLGSFVPVRNVELSLALPLTLVRGQRIAADRPVAEGAIQTGGLGDPRIGGKVRLVGTRQGIDLAAAIALSLPVAEWSGQDPDESHLGNDTPVVMPRAIVELRRRNAEIGLNLGLSLRPSARLHATDTGSRLEYGVAAAYRPTASLRAIVELFGGAGLSGAIDEAPLEGQVAGQVRIADLLVTVGAGAGLLRGVGVPDYRLLAGVLYSPIRGDLDADEVDDRHDRCPSEPEDADGYQDRDGCPEVDNDSDGFPDSADRCPFDGEDPDSHQDQDGCPELDNDGDGVRDGYDSCPNRAEDRDGDRDEDGCPDDDTDGDNIPDTGDRCPAELEDTDGFEDEDGCPDADNDHDGVADEQDQCEEPEDRDGVADQDGCPETDHDQDSIDDPSDRCPETPGRPVWQGCPTYPALRDALRALPPATAPPPDGSSAPPSP